MAVLGHRLDHLFPNQHYQLHHNYSSTSSPLQSNTLPLRAHSAQYLNPIPSEAEIARLSHSPLSTTVSSPATSTSDFDSRGDYYMQRASQGIPQEELNQPVVRHPSLETVGIPQAFWQQQQQQQPRSAVGSQRIRHSIPPNLFHKRTNSDSTIHSAPYTPTTFPNSTYQPYIVDSESHQYSPHNEIFDHHAQNITSAPKDYPQVTQALDHSHIFATDQNNFYNNAQSQLHWNEAMREAILQQQQFQVPNYHSMDKSFPKVLGLGPRTISEICQDELYNVAEPTISVQTSQTATPILHDNQPASPATSVFSQRLQAANQNHLDAARSASPTGSNFSRTRSPFRTDSTLQGSPFNPPSSPGPRMNTAAQLREVQRAEDAAHAIAIATRRASRESSQTVSPKEVTLEYEAENDSQPAMFASPPRQHPKRSRLNQEYSQPANYGNLLKEEASSNISNDSIASAAVQPLQIPQTYPFIQTYKAANPGVPESSQESNPRFPSTLISMESTRSGGSDRSSAGGRSPEVEEDEVSDEEDQTQDSEVSRPENTRSEGGTYTCTYHGCTQRFETPQKLQKHKKEGHRQGTPSTNADSRLTQAGPHKCERTNPQTGKPCNSIFSRPYDLTRHEDTIHNARKQKVRCMICTEEKTFSRNDALTRHMRVVHPEVEFPGKTKRGSR